ncbi:MAG: hypothetical protein ACE5KM_12600 [Planctomycetaceae bacterium]
MSQPRTFLRRLVTAAGLSCVLLTTAGCSGELIRGAVNVAYDFSMFWKTTPPIPVSAYFSELVEASYCEDERYNKVPILDPVEGEHAPLFCLDPPSPDEVMRALPDEVGGGVFFLAETQRNNVRIVVEPIVDRIDECRFYPMVGPARLHHCHYKCTVYYEKVIRSEWPVPFTHSDQTQEVVYIDHDHLIRCAGPLTPQ